MSRSQAGLPLMLVPIVRVRLTGVNIRQVGVQAITGLHSLQNI
jgi:hypothetical protein